MRVSAASLCEPPAPRSPPLRPVPGRQQSPRFEVRRRRPLPRVVVRIFPRASGRAAARPVARALRARLAPRWGALACRLARFPSAVASRLVRILTEAQDPLPAVGWSCYSPPCVLCAPSSDRPAATTDSSSFAGDGLSTALSQSEISDGIGQIETSR